MIDMRGCVSQYKVRGLIALLLHLEIIDIFLYFIDNEILCKNAAMVYISRCFQEKSILFTNILLRDASAPCYINQGIARVCVTMTHLLYHQYITI